MYKYFAYGLGIHCVLPLPELIPAEVEQDVLIYVGGQECIPEGVRGKPSYFSVGLDEVIISGEGVGTFLIRSGKEVCIIPAAGVEESRLRLNIVGAVLAFLLYQRGFLVLHASGNMIRERAVTFLGESGWGKSSMIAALHKRGHKIFTDDLLPILMDGETVKVLSGFPQIKLHPTAAATLGYDARLLHELDPSQTKRGFRLNGGFVSETLPLNSIYVLAEGKEMTIEPLQPQQAIIELIRHSYPTRARVSGGINHLSQCAELVRRSKLYRLTRPFSLSLLPQVAQMVEEHVLADS
jgi:hypothetical protein